MLDLFRELVDHTRQAEQSRLDLIAEWIVSNRLSRGREAGDVKLMLDNLFTSGVANRRVLELLLEEAAGKHGVEVEDVIEMMLRQNLICRAATSASGGLEEDETFVVLVKLPPVPSDEIKQEMQLPQQEWNSFTATIKIFAT